MIPCKAGGLFGDLETVRRMAQLSAEVTHNHPEGIGSIGFRVLTSVQSENSSVPVMDSLFTAICIL